MRNIIPILWVCIYVVILKFRKISIFCVFLTQESHKSLGQISHFYVSIILSLAGGHQVSLFILGINTCYCIPILWLCIYVVILKFRKISILVDFSYKRVLQEFRANLTFLCFNNPMLDRRSPCQRQGFAMAFN
jgi:hypothetical protein